MEKIMQRTEWIKNLGLHDLVRWVIGNNTSLFLPYHNYSHIMGFLYHALAAGYRENLETSQLQEIGVAVLFHDFNHSGGKLKDSQNIKKALEALESCPKDLIPEACDLEKVKDLIKATEYPYTLPEESLGIEQKIMRDCDLLWVVDSSSLIQNVLGLGLEMSGKIESAAGVIEGHRKFVTHEAESFRTTYAKDIWEVKKDDWNLRLNQFLNSIL